MKISFSLFTLLIFILLGTSLSQTGWFQQNSGTSSNLSCVFFVDTSIGYAVGNSVILKTSNGGTNWISQSAYSILYSSALFLDVYTGFTCGSQYVFKPTNGGTTWNISNTGASGTTMYSVYFINSTTGIAVGGTFVVKVPFPLIIRTTDGGISWSAQGVGTLGYLTSVYFPDALTGYICSFDGAGTFKTTNAGLSWFSIPSPSSSLHSIYFINPLIGWTVGINNVYKTTSGGNNWLSYTLTDTLQSVHFANDQTGWVCGSGGSIFESTNGGVNWTLQSTGITTNLNSLNFANSQTGWCVGASGKILKTANGGLTLIHTISNETPKEFHLYPNYPNPLNPTTKIRYQIPKSSSVKLSINDLLGREVVTLVNEKQNAGNYEV